VSAATPLVGALPTRVAQQVGVGGLLLGGGSSLEVLWGFIHTQESRIGYSYKTNQYGLCIDTIIGFNLVMPNGTVTYVTQSTQPDLFWGLKGGSNNFVSQIFLTSLPFGSIYPFQGIVTDFTMTTFPQTEIWVRMALFAESLR